jgi:hypothetical protein
MHQLLQLPNVYTKTEGCNTKIKRRSDHNKAAGSPSIFNFDDSTTQIYFSKSHDLHKLAQVLDEKVYWQPLYIPSDASNIKLVSLSAKQYRKLKRQMKISGPISGPEFNKIATNMSSKEGEEL